jgi:hypothetical protein
LSDALGRRGYAPQGGDEGFLAPRTGTAPAQSAKGRIVNKWLQGHRKRSASSR